MSWSDRHPSIQHFDALFKYDHLPSHLQNVSVIFYDAACELVSVCPDGIELTVALRKLWEAKNSAVVQAGFVNERNNG